MTTDRSALALLGFGEAAQAFATGTVARQHEVGALGLSIDAQDAQDLAKLSDMILAGLSRYTDQSSTKD